MHVDNIFWLNELFFLDFRGLDGNMCAGKAYIICGVKPLKGDNDGVYEGVFSETCTEVGVQHNGMRCCVKLDYVLLEGENPVSKDKKNYLAVALEDPDSLSLNTGLILARSIMQLKLRGRYLLK